MADDTVQIENLCYALVGSAEHQRFVEALLTSPQGQWHNLRNLMLQTGTTVAHVTAADDVFVAWLNDAVSSPGFVAIVFHHYETLWTSCVHYNCAALTPLHDQSQSG